MVSGIILAGGRSRRKVRRIGVVRQEELFLGNLYAQQRSGPIDAIGAQ